MGLKGKITKTEDKLKVGTKNVKEKSIRTKILGTMLIMLLLSLSAVSAVFSVMSLKCTKSTAWEIMDETGKIAARAVKNRLIRSKTIATEVGTIARLSEASVSKEEKLKILESKIKQYGLISMDVADKAGNTLRGKNISNESFFKEAMANKEVMIPPQPTADGTTTSMKFAAPLWGGGIYGTSILGVVYYEVDGSFLSGITNSINIGETGYAYIVDDNGILIAHPNQDSVLSQLNLIEENKNDPATRAIADLVLKAIDQGQINGEYKVNGLDRWGFFYPIEDTPWLVAVAVDSREFMETGYRTMGICIGISVVALIVAAVFILRLTSKITQPIKEAEAMANKMAQCNFDVEMTYYGNDEMGRLATSMRQMTANIKAVVREAGRALEEISKGNFQIVPEVEYSGEFVRIYDAIDNIIRSLSATLLSVKTSADSVNLGASQCFGGVAFFH